MTLPVLGLCLLVSMSVVAPGIAEQADAESLQEAITKGKPILSFRYRYEDVTDDAVGDKHARASTLRTAFGYESLPWKGFNVLLEGQNVAVLGNDLYNNGGVGDSNNGVRDRPVVADPAGTGINQAFAQYALGKTRLRLGREEILVGDQRYVGNVGWRQNHQSFDAFVLRDSTLEWADFFYSYVDDVNRINLGHAPMKTNLANAGFKLGKLGTITAYGYFLDYDQAEFQHLSTGTLGVELIGSWKIGDSTSLLYELEYADQSDFGDNPNEIRANYAFVTGGVELKPVSLRIGYELLGGSLDDGSFSTPLATLHKWNGWADKFLVTPPKGLRDLFVRLDGKLGIATWTVRYHDFESDQDSESYGTELDAEVLFKTPWNQGFGLTGAIYDADGYAEDTTKLWFYTTYKI
ncbi:MAG: alginate export family protein [Acidobacteriota bacterium]